MVLALLLTTIPLPSHCRWKGKHCALPSGWQGRWFEFGEREAISISNKTMSHKGHCLASKTNKFIFHDRKNRCHRCAVIYQKHHNVIQYKESMCGPSNRKNFNLCYGITADTPLKSMFRLDGTDDDPIPCPIGEADAAYQFSYQKGHGQCSYPMSSMSMCGPKNSRMVMRYQACADVKGSETSVKEVECYGSWKEGSTFYFLGMLNDSHVRGDNYEGRFRCFAYQKIFNGYKLSQSGDARCDIWSPDEGYITMKINKVSPSPGQECHLPNWVLGEHSSYLSMDKLSNYKFGASTNTSLTVTTFGTPSQGSHLKEASASSATKKKLTCSRLVKSEANFSRMIMQVNFDCESGFICLELVKKSSSVITTRMGRLSRNPDEACDQSLFFDKSTQSTVLVSEKVRNELCPLVGKYSLSRDEPRHHLEEGSSADSSNCPSGEPTHPKVHLSFGCSGETSFKHFNNCQKNAANLFQEFACQGGWREPLDSTDLPNVDLMTFSRSLATKNRHGQGVLGEDTRFQSSKQGRLSTQPLPEGYLQYTILSPLGPDANNNNTQVQLCGAIQIPNPLDLSTVRLVASHEGCPRPNSFKRGGSSTKERHHISWDYRLNRMSECAQALATANGTTPLQSKPLLTRLVLLLMIAARSLLGVASSNHQKLNFL